MSRNTVRRLNGADTALAVLSADLGGIVWANRAGRRLLGDDSLHLRSLQAATAALAERGRTQLLLRPADSTLGRALLVRLERDEALGVLLTARLGAADETVEQRAARLLADAGVEDSQACIASADGFLAGTPSLPAAERSLLGLQGAEFLQSDEDHLTIEDEAGSLVFARVADDLVLVHLCDRMPDPTAVPGDADGEADAAVAEAETVAAEPEPIADGEPAPDAEATADAERPEGVPAATDSVVEPEPVVAPLQEPFRARLDADPVRFVWQIDADGRFSQLSPEFAAVVGPHAADVIGRAFSDVAAVFGFDTGHEIERLLERRDTWSGRSVLWPVEGTDRRAPVDLAALPVFSRERRFEGFRGFGVVRPAESVADPDAIGLALSAPEPRLSTLSPDSTPESEPDGSPTATLADEPPPSRPFGRRTGAPERTSPASGGVVALEERRRLREQVLSSAEEAAFRAIGAELAPRPAAVPVVSEAAAGSPASALAAVFDALPLAVVALHDDSLVYANHRFFAVTGYESVADLEAAGGLDRLVVSCGGSDSEESRLCRADGSIVETGLHLQRITLAAHNCLLLSFPPLADDPAAREGERAQARELEVEVAELQTVLDTATDGILLLDEGARVRRMNGSAEALFGLEPDRYLNLPFTELLAPASRALAKGYIETLRDEGMAAVLNDGREVEALVDGGAATTPLFVTLGALAGRRGWCVVVRDLTHWKGVERDLVAARRQAEDASFHKSRFLANISHELRTPLNAIIGFADVMASECFGPIGHERYLEYLGDIKRSGHHVLDLVNDLLDISKIEAGKMELSFEAVALDEIVAEVVALMQPQANRERVIVRSVLPPDVPPVVADRRSVRQIALNLLANAVRFTPPGGQIIASTAYGEAGEVALRFRDSGIGMSEHEIAIALTPFQQVKSGGRGEGTGLGLPITKAMAEANQAVFTISSTPGEGTLVEIVFPAQRVLAH
ncbi:PAS domain S-box-containing protein [Aureimonas jatrophae]|uniref:histidine kinase n=2 Tax=Aureimonas jatrophae TaxID=1166073 RepID=A0A1H0L257_9HYPH|nr:PAS domain S-box-containing protein [Aureimonas jatrophae]